MEPTGPFSIDEYRSRAIGPCKITIEADLRSFPLTVTITPGMVQAMQTSPAAGAEVASPQSSPPPPQLARPGSGFLSIETGITQWERWHRTKGNGGQHLRESLQTVRDCAAAMGWKTITDASRESVSDWLIAKSATCGPRMLNHHRARLRQFFGFFVEIGALKINPTLGVPKVPVPKQHSRMVPTVEDVRQLILYARSRSRGGERWLYYLMAATTSIRPISLGRLRWEWIDLDLHDRASIYLPATAQKNRREAVVWLSKEVADILRAMPRKGDRVFSRVPKASTFRRDAEGAALTRQDRAGATLSPYSLKHFSITYLRTAETFTDSERQSQAAHDTAKMTTATYTHGDFPELGKKIYRLQPLLGTGDTTPPDPAPRRNGINPVDRCGQSVDTEGPRPGSPDATNPEGFCGPPTESNTGSNPVTPTFDRALLLRLVAEHSAMLAKLLTMM